jgi:uncharacterized protein (TIGR03435 family)
MEDETVSRALFLMLMFAQSPGFAQSAGFLFSDVRASAPTLDYHKRGMGGAFLSGDHLDLRRATMVNLIALAWGVDESKVLGGPNWIAFDRFDVRAKTPPGTTRAPMQPMLQALLKERFGLAAHRGTQEMPGWALTAGKNPQLTKPGGADATGCDRSGSQGNRSGVITVTCRNQTMAMLADGIPGMSDYVDEGYTVADRTGLSGAWNFTIRFAPSKSEAAANHSPTLFTALEQIGLKLEPATVAVEGIVVDRVNETPTPNAANLASVFPVPPTEFEVAVIKPSGSSERTLNGYSAADNTRVQYLQGGRVNIQGSLRGLIRWTFGINMVRVLGMPSWANDDSWDIQAKPPQPVNDSDTLAEMLKALLASRFKMQYHFEERPIDSYTLIVAKPRMKKADPSERTGCSEGPPLPSKSDTRDENPLLARLLTCRNTSIAQLAHLLFKGMASGYVGGPVFDATGLEGGWDFTLSFSTPASAGPPATADAAAEPTGALSLAEAMQKQIGIRMEMQKHPVEVPVIDHVERKPTEN